MTQRARGDDSSISLANEQFAGMVILHCTSRAVHIAADGGEDTKAARSSATTQMTKLVIMPHRLDIVRNSSYSNDSATWPQNRLKTLQIPLIRRVCSVPLCIEPSLPSPLAPPSGVCKRVRERARARASQHSLQPCERQTLEVSEVRDDRENRAWLDHKATTPCRRAATRLIPRTTTLRRVRRG